MKNLTAPNSCTLVFEESYKKGYVHFHVRPTTINHPSQFISSCQLIGL